jgi:amino acid adenylation domain-containing protein
VSGQHEAVRQLLRDVAARGLSITAAGQDLRLEGPRDRIDAELVGRIRAVKADLVAYLSAGGTADGPAVATTPLQRAYLFGRGELVELGNVASHVYHEIEGLWDVDRLEAALGSVVARHPALRTRFTADGHQVQLDDVPVRIGRLDLRPLPVAAREEARLALRAERSHRMLPVDRAPLLAVDVTVLADDRMVLHVGHDGLVMDGISMFLFFRAWWQAYQGQPSEATELPFADYVAALDRARDSAPARRSRAYWLDRLDDLAPYPDLPLAGTPSAVRAPRFTQYPVRLGAPEWTAVKQRAAQAGLTPNAVLLAAYAETLAAWGAAAPFTLTTTFAHRPPIHPRIFGAIGQFSDTLLLEVAADPAVTFTERALAVQTRLRTALENRHFSGVEVLRELGRRGDPARARAPYTFNSAIGYVDGEVDGSALELFGPEVYSVSQTPQVWLNAFAMEQHGGVVVQLDAVDELYPAGLVAALAEGYRTMLDRLADGSAWSRRVVDLLPPAQRARRAAANDTAAAQSGRRLGEDFLAHAVRAPQAPAVVTSDGVMTYGELHTRATRAAAWLREHGVGRDELVALVMTRGPEQIVGILATVLAGGAYLPVDPGLPARRQAYMLRDGRVRCVLTNTSLADGVDAAHVLTVDRRRPPEPDGPVDVPALPGADPDDLAYVLYTSGTTGEPKGVMISHRSVANVVADCNTRFRVGPADRFLAVSAFTFDLSVWDVFGALSAGAALVQPDHDRAVDPAHWLDLCAGAGVTVWNSVPAIVGLLHDQAEAAGAADRLATLRLVMMSGDRIPPELPVRLRRLLPHTRLVSLGGPTETTIWNILHPIRDTDGGDSPVPYGRPNANNRAYVLDPAGRDAPDWVSGEICAAGVGLARGYWGDEARTAERFFLDPVRGERLYRTGDLGRYLPDGEIEILGRSDFQIKVNGYRIEAGEVETRLAALDSVKQAAVVRQDGPHGARLVAHLAAAGDARPTVEEVRDRLRAHLPEYMTPSAVVWHEALPLTRNGKVDRVALAATVPDEPVTAPAPGADATGADERELAAIWAKVLRLPEVRPDANFYDLGGDSLSAARILTEVRKRYAVTIPLDQLYSVATVRSMAARVAAGATPAKEGDR